MRYVVAFLIFLLTIELCTRIDDKLKYNAPFSGIYSVENLRRSDALGFLVNAPGSRFEKWENNSFGFRGPEITLQKPDGVVRCVCMGTSETYGLYEGPGKEWPSRLNEILGGKGNYEVINSAIVGLRMDDYKVYLAKHVLKFKPDIVVIMINPYMYFAGLVRRENQSNARQKQKVTICAEVTKEAPFFVPRSYTRLTQVTKKTLKGLIPESWLKSYQINAGLKQVKEAQRWRLKNKKPLETVPQEHIDTFRDELRSLILFIQDNNAKVILSTYPVLIDKHNVNNYYEEILDTQRFSAEFSIEGLLDASNAANNVIMQTARELGVGVVDNYHLVQKTTEYFADNVHYTDKGADAVAKNMARYIVDPVY